MRKQLFAVTIAVLLVLSVFSVLQFWQIKPVQATGITHVIGQSGRQTTETTSLVVTMALTPTSGNVLIAVIGTMNGTAAVTVSSIAESNVVWTLQTSKSGSVGYHSANYADIEIWCGVVSTSASTTVTITLSTNCQKAIADIYEYSGLATTGFLDKTASNSGHTDATDTGTTATTTEAAELWIGGISAIENINNQTVPTNGFTLYDGNYSLYSGAGVRLKVGFLEKIVSSTGAANSGTTCASNDWQGCIATFKVAPAPLTSYPCKYLIFTNTTSTYRQINATGVIDDSGSSLSVINNAILNATVVGSPQNIFLYNGTYFVAGTIGLRNNVTLVLQDNVNITKTVDVGNIVTFGWFAYSCSNAWIIAEEDAVIKGNGTADEQGFLSYASYGASSNDSIIAYGSLEIWNVGRSWLNFNNAVNCTFQNINAHDWNLYSYAYHGMLFDGMLDCQLINITSNGVSGNTRSALCIGGSAYPVNNVNITGGTYEYSYYDNGIYLGGWEQSITNVTLTNVTTAYNNGAHSGHSGLKIRPACNVTVTGWVSNGDYIGIECGSTMPGESGATGSMYLNISGTINNPVLCGLILAMDDDAAGLVVGHNFFNLTIINAGNAAVYIGNGDSSSNTAITDNTVHLNVSDCSRSAISFENYPGNVSFNTFYGIFDSNGEIGFPDINILNTAATNNNTFNIYSTVGNPNGLQNFVNGTGSNYVYYPYSYTGPPPTLVTITITSPTNSTYSSSTITVQLSATVSGSTLDKIWWNCQNGTTYIYASNQTYTVTTQMTGIANGIQYTFHAYANATDGTTDHKTVMFSVSISSAGITSIIVNVWWSGWW